MPAMLLSGLMLPMSLAPGWLDVLSHFVPFRYLVDAVRDAYVGALRDTGHAVRRAGRRRARRRSP